MSAWFPIGPDSVYATRDPMAPRRLSRRNEWARQAKVASIAVDPFSVPATLYTVERPYPQPADNRSQAYPQLPYWPVGGAAFRSQDDGRSWTPIADTLIQASPALIPTCIAVHPVSPNYIYLGTTTGEVHVSDTRGDGWVSFQSLGAEIRQIVVDPRGAASPGSTTIYAATASGLQRSTDGGGTWVPTTLAGDVMSLAFNMPSAGSADLYAGVRSVGLYHATDAAGTWTLLSGAGSGLPAHSGNNFTGVLVDFCRLSPGHVYVVLGPDSGNISLYGSSTGPTGFAALPSAPPPPSDLYRFAFAVAPNSPGGATDVLLFSGVGLYRSSDGGATWVVCADDPHGDHNCLGFSPPAPPPGVIPTVFVGCDGGLFASTSLADGAANVALAPTDFSDGTVYTASGVAQSYNHGKLSVAVSAYAADASSAARGYSAGQDTGLAGHLGSLGWRGLDNSSDVWSVAVKAGADGLKVWYRTPFDTRLITDHGETFPTPVVVATSNPQSGITGASSTMRVDAGGQCLVGAYPSTALQNPVNAGANQVATPFSMLGIAPGVTVAVGNDYVTVQTVTATTFNASFFSSHLAGTAVKAFGGVVWRIDQSALATPVSQTLGLDIVKALAAHPSDANFAVCVTGRHQSTPDQRVWIAQGAPLGQGKVWQEITGTTRPSGGQLSSAAIDHTGKVYVLLTDLTWSAPGGGSVTTPLYEVSSGAWLPQACAGLPAGPYGAIVVRPGATDTLYVAAGAQVYELTLSGGIWTWTQVGSGLPGQAVVDVWVGDAGAPGTPKVLLRAAVVSRGVWEADVTTGAGTPDPPARPYMRHQPLDMGWLSPSLEGQVDPFAPSAGPSLYHWESPDIRIDARHAASGGNPPYYQTDPEEPLPISDVAFDRMVDNSQALPQSDLANAHVLVHNRSYTSLGGVSVWAVWCRCASGVPSLAESAMSMNMFDFWGQFHADGTVHPGLPLDSPWHSLGNPVVLDTPFDAAHPRVASFPDWTIPTLAPGDNGHYCMVAFAHSQAHPINESKNSVDAIAVSNPQVAQKNLHVTPMAPVPGPPRGQYGFREYIEFHGLLDREESLVDLVLDFSPLPRAMRAFVQLTHVDIPVGPEKAVTGGVPVTRPGENADADERAHPGLGWLREWSRRFAAAARHEDRDRDPDDREYRPRFTSPIYAVEAGRALTVTGVRFEPFTPAAAIFAVTADAPPEQDLRFRIYQRSGRRVIGGSTYLIRGTASGGGAPAFVG